MRSALIILIIIITYFTFLYSSYPPSLYVFTIKRNHNNRKKKNISEQPNDEKLDSHFFKNEEGKKMERVNK